LKRLEIVSHLQFRHRRPVNEVLRGGCRRPVHDDKHALFCRIAGAGRRRVPWQVPLVHVD